MHDLKSLISDAEPKVGEVFFIAVDGHGGSGKSTLGALLAKTMKADLIHTDDFAGFDNNPNWPNQLTKSIFIPILNGAKILNYERSKWWENHYPAPVSGQPVTRVMILEGVSSLRKEFRDFISLGIFVDTPRDICLRRGIERDKKVGLPKSELLELWKNWLDEEDKYFERDNPKDYAEIVVDGTQPFEKQFRLEI